MTDTIHKKKKSWPHFDKFYVGSREYQEGYERIFGKKVEHEQEVNETRRRRKIRQAGSKGSLKSSRRVDRKKKVRQGKISENGG